jgi:hypothetical protein
MELAFFVGHLPIHFTLSRMLLDLHVFTILFILKELIVDSIAVIAHDISVQTPK